MSRTTQVVKAVILDLDDTLLMAYRRPDLAWRAVCEACADDLRPLSADEAAKALTRAGEAFWNASDCHAIGRADPRRARKLIVAAAFDGLRLRGHKTPAPAVADRLAEAFSQHRDAVMRLEHGAQTLLSQLRHAGYRLALLTNGTGPLQRAKIERFGLEGSFDLIQIEGEVGIGKPDTAAYERVFDALDVRADEVCIIGDSIAWDIATPRRLGCLTILYDPDADRTESPANGEAHLVARDLLDIAEAVEALRL